MEKSHCHKNNTTTLEQILGLEQALKNVEKIFEPDYEDLTTTAIAPEAMSMTDDKLHIYIPCINGKKETIEATIIEEDGIAYLVVTYEKDISIPEGQILYDSPFVRLADSDIQEIRICLDDTVDIYANCEAVYRSGMIIVSLQKTKKKNKMKSIAISYHDR